jgi:hypothetical protein
MLFSIVGVRALSVTLSAPTEYTKSGMSPRQHWLLAEQHMAALSSAAIGAKKAAIDSASINGLTLSNVLTTDEMTSLYRTLTDSTLTSPAGSSSDNLIVPSSIKTVFDQHWPQLRDSLSKGR